MVSIALLGLMVLGFFLSRSQSQSNLINVQETYRKALEDSSTVLLDVRTQTEWDDGHIDGALFIPVQELQDRVAELEQYKDKTIIAYCRSGNRSGVAAKILEKQGYSVLNMEGGIIRWQKEDLPLTKESKK